MRLFRPLLALALTALAGCSEQPSIITRLDATALMSPGMLYSMSAGGGVPVEAHGVPFEGATPAEIAARLRPPPGVEQSIRFRPIAPGAWGEHDSARMVLIFQGREAPDGAAACRLRAPAAVGAPPPGRFAAFLVFCERDRPFGQGHIEALKQSQGDWTAFSDHIQTLIRQILSTADANRR